MVVLLYHKIIVFLNHYFYYKKYKHYYLCYSVIGLTNPNGECESGYVCVSRSNTSRPTDGATGYLCPIGHYCPVGSSIETRLLTYALYTPGIFICLYTCVWVCGCVGVDVSVCMHVCMSGNSSPVHLTT